MSTDVYTHQFKVHFIFLHTDFENVIFGKKINDLLHIEVKTKAIFQVQIDQACLIFNAYQKADNQKAYLYLSVTYIYTGLIFNSPLCSLGEFF